MKTCPNKHEGTGLGDKFCYLCGYLLREESKEYCKDCGYTFGRYDKFCTSCGKEKGKCVTSVASS